MTAPAANPVPENVIRGTLFTLVAVPAGIVLWVVIWSFGFVSALVAFAIAVAATWLYRKGSGGRVSKKGAMLISGVVLVTLLLSFYFGLVTDYVRAVSDQTALTWIQVFTHPLFWSSFNEEFGPMLNDNIPNLLMALAFGVLGAFTTLRRVFASAKTPESRAALPPRSWFAAPPAPPIAPQPAPQVNSESTGTLNGGTGEQPTTI
jgi:hypothetical protein